MCSRSLNVGKKGCEELLTPVFVHCVEGPVRNLSLQTLSLNFCKVLSLSGNIYTTFDGVK